MDEKLDRAPIGVLDCSTDGTVTGVNEAARRLLDVGTDDVTGADVGTVFPRSVENTLSTVLDAGPLTEDREFEEYYPDLERWLVVSLVPVDGEVTVYLRDVTDRRSHERTVADVQGQLDRLILLNGLISEILTDLVDASTRDEIAETICKRLGETDIYEFAWVGERKLGADEIVVRASSGATGRTFENLTESLSRSEMGPEERAAETGTLQVVRSLASDETVPEAVRRAAFAEGLQSMLAIPLTFGTEVHGVVGVYSSEREAFSSRERASFETVGEIAGFAVNATRNRNLLLSDTVTELTFEVTDPASPLVAASADLSAALSLAGMVSHDDRGLLCYFRVDGEPPATVAETIDFGDDAVVSRIVNDSAETGSVEMELGTETLLGVLSTLGVSIRSAEFEDGSGRIVVELSPDESVRRIADAVTRQFDADVVAVRERERPVTTANELRDELGDRLTDQQEAVLRTAFFADYFESPRGSTAEEVASTLGITGSTLLYHLRAAQRKLLDSFFDDSVSVVRK